VKESTINNAAAELKTLHERIRSCTQCGLHTTRTNAVPGTGPVPCQVMIVGEAPGFNEDVQGLPFVGAAGNLLDTLLGQIGFTRDQVFITNILKCRPPQNRDPMPNEAETCLPFLRQQFKLIQPKAVLILGRHALERMLPGVGPISRVHGQIFERMGVAFMPVYHPAAALHNGTLLKDLQDDFDKVKVYLGPVLAAEQATTSEEDATSAEAGAATKPGLPPGEQLPLL
jgi:uracil-DNA glycosylase family 4